MTIGALSVVSDDLTVTTTVDTVSRIVSATKAFTKHVSDKTPSVYSTDTIDVTFGPIKVSKKDNPSGPITVDLSIIVSNIGYVDEKTDGITGISIENAKPTVAYSVYRTRSSSILTTSFRPVSSVVSTS